MTSSPYLILAKEIQSKLQSFSHPWNAHSLVNGAMLGRATGLKRVGVNFAVIPPGKESFVYHSHQCEEEWVYILSGSGLAEIDGDEWSVGAGDFMGFPTPNVAHHLRNNGSQPLVYLMGGESRDLEVADFPKLGRCMIRRGDQVDIYDKADGRPFGPDQV